MAKKGQSFTMKILLTNRDEMQNMFGHNFDIEDELVSYITQQSNDL
jgi:hypothetical protein